MKCIVLASFLLVCSASTLFSGKNISVNDDGTIHITGHNGKRVVITRPTDLNGRKNIEITVAGPNTPTKRIEINDQNNFVNRDDLYDGVANKNWNYGVEDEDELREKRGSTYKKDKYSTQGDILSDIIQQYQGNLDDVSYGKLLKNIEKAVQQGQISETIYDLLNDMGAGQLGQVGLNGKTYGGRYFGNYKNYAGYQNGAGGLGSLLRRNVLGGNAYTQQYGMPNSWLGQSAGNVVDQIQQQSWLQNQMNGNWGSQYVDEMTRGKLVRDIERKADLVGEIGGQDVNSQIQREQLVNEIVREKDLADAIQMQDVTRRLLNNVQLGGDACNSYNCQIVRDLLTKNYLLRQTVGPTRRVFFNENAQTGRPITQGLDALGQVLNIPYHRNLYNANQLVY